MSIDPTTIAAAASDRQDFAVRLENACAAAYREQFAGASLTTFEFKGAAYLFDATPGVDRTVLVIAAPTPPGEPRDRYFQEGYPLSGSASSRPVDRGHFIAHSAGGDFGPNLFVQDRALNRGWSREGRAYRTIERTATLAGTAALLFVHPVYIDMTAMPAFLQLGLWGNGTTTSAVFRNRFDEAALAGADPFEAMLAGATNDQAGALGEETARIVLEEAFDAQMLYVGDSGMERDGHRQGLDLLALVGGEVIAYEVKTRHVSRDVGIRTRAGNLRRARLRRTNLDGVRQGSTEYVAARAAPTIDVGQEWGHPEARVVVVDLVGMLLQVFPLTDSGRVAPPEHPPIPCETAARVAFDRIIDYRGYL